MQAQNDKVRKAADEAIEKLAGELASGKSDALKNYLATAARFHKYSWNNVLLIAGQRPEATRVAGIHAWNDLGRTVRKGEKAIAILAPVLKKQADVARDLAKPSDPEQGSRLVGFRTAYVFDVSQTDGKPLPEFARTTGDPGQYTDRLKAFAANRGVTVEYDRSIAPAMGVSSGGRIRLVPDLPKAEEFSVLAHELAHEMLHHGKEDRLPKAVRETQAEAVAFVVSHAVGLETNHAAADYITLYNGDKNTLAESLHKIHATATEIIEKILPEHDRTQEPNSVQRNVVKPELEPRKDPSPSHTPDEPSSPSR